MKKLAIFCVLLTTLTALGAGFYMSLDSSGNSVVYSDYFSGDGSLLTGLTATSMPQIALLTTTQATLKTRSDNCITTNTAQTTAIGNLATTSAASTTAIGYLTTTQSTLRAEMTAAINTNTAQTTWIGTISNKADTAQAYAGTNLASIGVLNTGVVYLTTAAYTDAVAKAGSAVQPAEVFGTVSFATPVITTTTGTCIMSVKDLDGETLTGHRVWRLYVAESPYDGTPTTNNIDTGTITAGSAIETVTANCHWMVMSQTSGAAQVTLVGTAAGTNWLVSVSGNGAVTVQEVVFVAGE